MMAEFLELLQQVWVYLPDIPLKLVSDCNTQTCW